MHETLALSKTVLDSVGRTRADKFSLPESAVVDIRQALERYAELVEPDYVPAEIGRDPDDRAILGTAAAARADLVITVERDLLLLRRYASADVVKPGSYWERQRNAKTPPT